MRSLRPRSPGAASSASPGASSLAVSRLLSHLRGAPPRGLKQPERAEANRDVGKGGHGDHLGRSLVERDGEDREQRLPGSQCQRDGASRAEPAEQAMRQMIARAAQDGAAAAPAGDHD